MQEAGAAEEEGGFELVAARPTAAAGGVRLASKPSRPTEYEASGGRELPCLQVPALFLTLRGWVAETCGVQQALEGFTRKNGVCRMPVVGVVLSCHGVGERQYCWQRSSQHAKLLRACCPTKREGGQAPRRCAAPLLGRSSDHRFSGYAADQPPVSLQQL